MARRGEKFAARHLKRRGYLMLLRNYSCPAGEIDLICADRDTIVFVEVKTRDSTGDEDPRQIVRPDQWRRIGSAAHYYLRERTAKAHPCRIDLIVVQATQGGAMRAKHFENVFQP